MYLTYEEYQNMGGTLDATTFNDYSYEAECTVNLYTYDRLKKEETIPEEVKKCIYALIKLMALKNAITPSVDSEGNASVTHTGITSQSNDGVSISYNVLSATEILNTYRNEVREIIDRYLYGVRNSLGHRLLFKGIYPNE